MRGLFVMEKMIRCYAEGRGGQWEAICLDLDVAVQGQSFDDVYKSLGDAVRHYIESVSELPASDQARLLDRRVPLSIRFRFVMHVLRSLFSGRRDDDSPERAEFTMSYAA